MTIYCIGRNYAEHAKELGNAIPESPVVFIKSNNSFRGFPPCPIAFENEVFHFEAEIVLKIAKDLTIGQLVTTEAISSLLLGIDLTRRGVQSELKAQGHPWTLAKSFLGSAILGKEYPLSAFEQLRNITFQLKVNGSVRQVGNTNEMLFSFLDICNYINSFSPLQKGDLIFTGTPKGVGEIRKGDTFEMNFEGHEPELGVL